MNMNMNMNTTTIMNAKLIKEFQSLIDYHKSEGTNNFKYEPFKRH